MLSLLLRYTELFFRIYLVKIPTAQGRLSSFYNYYDIFKYIIPVGFSFQIFQYEISLGFIFRHS